MKPGTHGWSRRLKRAEYDGVAIGGYINGQDAVNFPATVETTAWFNRVLNIVHASAPSAKIILVRGPEDVRAGDRTSARKKSAVTPAPLSFAPRRGAAESPHDRRSPAQ